MSNTLTEAQISDLLARHYAVSPNSRVRLDSMMADVPTWEAMAKAAGIEDAEQWVKENCSPVEWEIDDDE